MNDQDLRGLSRKLNEEAQPAHGAASMPKLPLARQRPLRLRALGQVRRWIVLLILDTANAQMSLWRQNQTRFLSALWRFLVADTHFRNAKLHTSIFAFHLHV